MGLGFKIKERKRLVPITYVKLEMSHSIWQLGIGIWFKEASDKMKMTIKEIRIYIYIYHSI